ncbi:MAG TPA: ABC transporter permease [Pyrinomonadaceae bacterium]|jgi:NitT/TauT family transport system permease protein|nr:ABC transporter permease [Pyrinomonadaceae bacterium]
MSIPTRDVKSFFRPTVAPSARKHHAHARWGIRSRLSAREDWVIGLIGIGTVILIWCALVYSGLVQTIYLPTPGMIWRGLVEYHVERNWLFPAIGRSAWRVARGLALVLLIGIPIGVLMGAFSEVDAFFRKIVNGAKAVPVTALVGLVTLWFGIYDMGKVAYLVLGAIFYMIILVKNAVAGVNEEYVRVALDIGANRWQIIWRVLLPGALPQIWDAIAVCIGIMWTYIILAEILNSNVENLGVGYLLSLGARLGGNSSGKMFGMLIVVGLISTLTDYLLNLVRRRFFNW